MSETARLLKTIIKTSGWTQEQVAIKLGVSYPTMNSWINGKSRPRRVMTERIQKLYLAQDITKDAEPTYVTLANLPGWLKVGDYVILEKKGSENYNDETVIGVTTSVDGEKWVSKVVNSVDHMVKGTSSAGRIYDKFEDKARAKVMFIFHGVAIARVLEWNYAKKEE